jgi:hypothetical protein
MSLQGECDAIFDRSIAGAMSRELHKTAQPLTILQGLLEFMQTRVSSGDECRQFLERVGEEAPRLAGCEECRCFLKRAGEELPRLMNGFNDVRKLAGLQRPARDITTFALAPLVAGVLQNLKGDLDIAGVTVIFDELPNDGWLSDARPSDVRPNNAQPNSKRPDEGPLSVQVNASHSRVFTAVRLVLMALADCFDAGDQIAVSIETDGSNAAITFRPFLHSQPGAIAKYDLLLSTLAAQLEFARLLFTSAGGELRLNRTADIVTMSLPAVASQPAAHHNLGEAAHV